MECDSGDDVEYALDEVSRYPNYYLGPEDVGGVFREVMTIKEVE